MSGISQQDVDEALRDIDDLIDSIGDQTQQTINAQVDETGDPVTGRAVQRGDHVYQVLATPAWNFVQVQAKFDAAEARAFERAQADGGSPAGGPPMAQPQISAPAIQRHRGDLLDNLSEEEHEDLRVRVIDALTEGDLVAALLPGQRMEITGVEVQNQLFIYDEDISISEFNTAVQEVINTLWDVKEILVEAYGLRDGPVSTPSDDTPAFQ